MAYLTLLEAEDSDYLCRLPLAKFGTIRFIVHTTTGSGLTIYVAFQRDLHTGLQHM